ncbi:MAG: hemerythrin domain-containing protein [Erythrobacter sp.]|uniref:hemerythrin domain-containing protein n=1 Tax=Erythrobacter sp. TaxID=1042 RepID=UPI0026183B76|nr:hemerythrin domain-containing protein [Erythrobacter sp.]MDJ0977565.1 hemerythrin domain-containing protein [Erythrobacter sp.]
MSDAVRELFDEFRRDHATLGRGLHNIAVALRAGDDEGASVAARDLDRAAGAHIAFEEGHFYPELRELLGDSEVDAFEREHERGYSAIDRLLALKARGTLTPAERSELLRQIEAMQTHTDECGEHFGALGRIPLKRQKELLAALKQLREEAPTWTAVRAQGTA